MRIFLLVVGDAPQEQIMRHLNIHCHGVDLDKLNEKALPYFQVGASSEDVLPNNTTYENVPQPIRSLLQVFSGSSAALKLTPELTTQIEHCFVSASDAATQALLCSFLSQHKGKFITVVDF